MITHGMSKKNIYRRWADMKSRCFNENNKKYKHYGGRGITVCESWMEFENFYNDMGDVPRDKCELDRKDNNMGYSKSNCRWVDRIINQHNTNSKKNSTSNFKGVNYDKNRKKWTADCKRGGKRKRKRFDTEIQAALYYNLIAKELYGEFAYQNDIR